MHTGRIPAPDANPGTIPHKTVPSAEAGLSLASSAASDASGGHTTKILSREQLLRLRELARADGRRVVQCHGCFDIVHPGHVRHLRQAKTYGEVLLVSITGDTEVRKGAGRPLIPEELRAENLAALDFVDWVYVEERPTAAELLDEVRPDVFVKGKEYEINNDPRFAAERSAVERHGGRVVFSSGDVVFSSTALIASLEQSADPYHARLRQLLEHDQLSAASIGSLIGRFRGKRVTVVGECLTDTYVLCDRPSIAAESPVMTLRPVEHRTFDGGAPGLARQLAALGAHVTLVTALSRTPESDSIRRRLLADGVQVRSLATDSRPAEVQRFLVGTQKVLKLDLIDPLRLDSRQQAEFTALADEASRGAEAAIVSDFGGGLLSPGVLRPICAAMRRNTAVLAASAPGQRAALRTIRAIDLLAITESDLRQSLHMFDEALPAAVWKGMHQTGASHTLLSMGSEGLVAFSRLPDAESDTSEWRSRVRAEHVPPLGSPPVDSLGCEESQLAVATLAMAAGGSVLVAAFLAAIAGSIQGARPGNTVVSITDLRQGAARVHGSHLTFAGLEAPRGRPAEPTGFAIGGAGR